MHRSNIRAHRGCRILLEWHKCRKTTTTTAHMQMHSNAAERKQQKLVLFKKKHTVCLFRLAVIGVDRIEISQKKLAFLILSFPNLPEQGKLYREHLVWKAFSLRINTASNIFFYYNTVVTKHTLASRGLSGKHQCSQGLRNWFLCLCGGGGCQSDTIYCKSSTVINSGQTDHRHMVQSTAKTAFWFWKTKNGNLYFL